MVPMVSSSGGTIGSQASQAHRRLVLVLDETNEDGQQGNGSLGAAAKRLSSTQVGLSPRHNYPPAGIFLGRDLPARRRHLGTDAAC